MLNSSFVFNLLDKQINIFDKFFDWKIDLYRFYQLFVAQTTIFLC